MVEACYEVKKTTSRSLDLWPFIASLVTDVLHTCANGIQIRNEMCKTTILMLPPSLGTHESCEETTYLVANVLFVIVGFVLY